MKDIDKVIKDLGAGMKRGFLQNSTYLFSEEEDEIYNFINAIHDAIELLKVMQESNHEWVK